MAEQTFPSPIGGLPMNKDFAPSIIFAIAYSVVVVLGIYRLARPSSRTLCTFGAFAFVVERVVIYALRAKESRTPSEWTSKGLMQYWQITYVVGYLSLTDIAGVLRCLLVNATLASKPSVDSGSFPMHNRREDSNTASKDCVDVSYSQLLPQDDDQPRARIWYRRICFHLMLLSLVPVIMGTIAGIEYTTAETNTSTASMVQSLRYAAAIISFVQILAIQGLSVWSYLYVRCLRREGAVIVFIIATLLNVISVYHLIIMRLKTTSITSTGPHSLNNPESKATFYIFQAAPECIAAAILFSVNVREIFGTGLFGDHRLTDKKVKTESSA